MNKVVEYMLAGKPILASYSGHPSMINEAACGTFIDTDAPTVIKEKLKYFCTKNKPARSQGGKNKLHRVLFSKSIEFK